MNRTIKDAAVKRYYYQTHDLLKSHLQTFLVACKFARRLKTLKGLTSYEFIGKTWVNESECFKTNPAWRSVELNT